ncbi:uncharacterized protein LOC120682623 [Panicum virgatum]|uniref:uncharacterized protein LOC120682623 n=1 Tax=Panicum virgatum TaxID=38727 RepID=UPI0019D5E9C3|nr:uncharacterized protein LOC120682623 [Panicum virgatum]
MNRKKEPAHPIASSWETIADEAVRKAVFKLVSAGCRTPELALEVAKELVQSIVEQTRSSSDGESSKAMDEEGYNATVQCSFDLNVAIKKEGDDSAESGLLESVLKASLEGNAQLPYAPNVDPNQAEASAPHSATAPLQALLGLPSFVVVYNGMFVHSIKLPAAFSASNFSEVHPSVVLRGEHSARPTFQRYTLL